MSYTELLQSEKSIKSGYLSILVPRRRIVDWTLFSGFVYSVPYDLGDIDFIEENGTRLTEAGSTSLNSGEWFLDGSTLYLRTLQSADPDSVSIVINYRIYVATSDTYHHEDPIDDSTEVVYWNPYIKSAPAIKVTISDALFGALPVQSSVIKLINAEHFFEPHIYESSFNRGSIRIYHWLDEIEVDNIKLVYDGLMSNVLYDNSEISIKTVDRIDEFSQEYRNLDTSFFNTTDFPNVDPAMVGKPIRYVYGYVKGFLPVNVDYVQVSPTTSDNRDWVVMGEQTGLTEVSRVVQASSTDTRTYVDFAEGIQVGDTVWLDRVIGTDEYVEVTAVSYSPAYIEHAMLSGGAMATNDHVKKHFVSRIEILKDNTTYLALYGRDYTVSTAMAAGCSGFSFSSSLESNLSMASNLTPGDVVLCTVYGRTNDLTAGGPTFGANDTITNNITNPVMVIYDLLKNKLGMDESRINLTQFAAIRSETAAEGIGVSIPLTKSGSFPNFKALILDILQTSLLKIYLDDDLKWTISRLKPLTATTKSIESNDIYGESFAYEFNYADIISDVIVEYLRMESSNLRLSETRSNVTAESAVAKYVHKIEKQKSFRSLHFRESDAQTLANRLSYALGDRTGTISFSTNHKFFNSIIGDIVSISREKLPGFEFEVGESKTLSASVTDISKTLKKISIEMDDQKGIEDNASNW